MNSPTLTALEGTQLGVILGTAAYMAPEQARGGAVDKRADIWAFGVVLWEMLCGRSLFAAETVSDTLPPQQPRPGGGLRPAPPDGRAAERQRRLDDAAVPGSTVGGSKCETSTRGRT